MASIKDNLASIKDNFVGDKKSNSITKTDIALRLLRLYRDLTKARHNNDSDKASNDLFEDPDTSTVERMTSVILSSLDNHDFDNALTLLNMSS